uniref:Uncharacterized protein n=1 Tax=Romanomermis culicivorax TaxID=13658 RepID=A0A915I6G6_ROMCU
MAIQRIFHPFWRIEKNINVRLPGLIELSVIEWDKKEKIESHSVVYHPSVPEKFQERNITAQLEMRTFLQTSFSRSKEAMR